MSEDVTLIEPENLLLDSFCRGLCQCQSMSFCGRSFDSRY